MPSPENLGGIFGACLRGILLGRIDTKEVSLTSPSTFRQAQCKQARGSIERTCLERSRESRDAQGKREETTNSHLTPKAVLETYKPQLH